jgi:hypothetical protein
VHTPHLTRTNTESSTAVNRCSGVKRVVKRKKEKEKEVKDKRETERGSSVVFILHFTIQRVFLEIKWDYVFSVSFFRQIPNNKLYSM